eukprot:CAMPEP_0172519194 /NCGR_PEP_ID=MMETSP1066-20121228/291269_1 /TAXON_ID=671091 /ORGANISM="Coscinodiscus wailesii, Strain CCMP2513" /LENGTH=97 /DNA_ID=CAMNT_0013301733 /DNA_START=1017 /DNA_END=1311 /DNA_ORIENTATION=-
MRQHDLIDTMRRRDLIDMIQWRDLIDTMRRRDGDPIQRRDGDPIQRRDGNSIPSDDSEMTKRRRYDDGDNTICGGRPRDMYEFLGGAFAPTNVPREN